MRTREMSYSYYGLNKKEIEYIREYCKKFNHIEDDVLVLKNAFSDVPAYISPYLFQSIKKDMSYEDICKKEYLYIGKADFYAYKRKLEWRIEQWMITYNIWDWKITYG